MLFIIGDSLIPQLTQPIIDHNLIRILDDLARFRRDGTHLISGSREILTKLKYCSGLNTQSRTIYKNVYNNLPIRGRLQTELYRKIEIVNDDLLVPEYLSNQNQQLTFRVPFNLFTNIMYFAKPILLGENLNDTDIYAHIAKTYLAMSPALREIRLVFEPRLGGGSTTATVYDSIQKNEHRLCLCIVDNDKKTPTSRLGQTAKAVKRSDDPDCLFTELHIIDSRDIENLLPTSILDKINHSGKNMIAALGAIETSNQHNARYHIDIKEGLKAKDIIHALENDPIRTYWEPICQVIGFTNYLSCSTTCTSSTCTCTIIDGLGMQVLSACLAQFFEVNTPHKIAETLGSNPDLKSKWEDLGKIIVGWCCGGTPIRSTSV